eukprot:TRINITY_DN14348_c0_g1_i1.p1 TRINITY_DN14348_c0_g1~~TRINITY_DN14348_c0_g1_i1.p1  ORF type:complete len:615 (-),score=92.13 TRINITY_DN14348_c0_g1_i1:566-2410(-)
MLPQARPFGSRSRASSRLADALVASEVLRPSSASSSGSSSSTSSRSASAGRVARTWQKGEVALPSLIKLPQPSAPKVSIPSGTYEEGVLIQLGVESGDSSRGTVRYCVEEVSHLDAAPLVSPGTHGGNIYRKPFVLDRIGMFVVQAVTIRDTWGLESSPTTKAVYNIRPAPPVFKTTAGTYKETVTVELASSSANPSADIRYTMSMASEIPGELSAQSSQYHKAIVLDKPGHYFVVAATFVKGVSSKVIKREYVVEARGVGEKLRALPGAMVQGLLSFKGATEAVIAPRLDQLRQAIARASGAAASAVSVEVRAKKDAMEKGVDVGFSVEAERMEDAEAMAGKLTDPSLVQKVAALTKLDVQQITVESKAQALKEVFLSLGWTNPGVSRDYLDGSCLVYAEDRLVEVVDYRGALSQRQGIKNNKEVTSATYEWSAGKGNDACITHSGDVLTSDGGSHVIRLRLDTLPANVTDCFFVLSAYNCGNLSMFKNPRMQIFDAENPHHSLSSYAVADAGSQAAVTVCSLSRDGDAWAVNVYGLTSGGTVRCYTPIEEKIASIQAKYGNWRRRRDLILLSNLWHSDRAYPRAVIEGEPEDAVAGVLELPAQLFQHVVQFL